MFSMRHRPIFDFQNELHQMRKQINELLGTPGASVERRVHPTGYPLLNCWEDDHNYYIEAELPGLALEDLDISMADRNTITIKGSRKEPAIEGAQWHRRERAFGEFERSLELPGAVDADQVEASFKHGVLTIKLPKAPELRPRKIEVKAS
jgi:HSP20 family protein